MKQLWLLVGGNGAGKSTFYRTQLKPLGMPFVNADDIARDVFPQAPEEHSYEAAKLQKTCATVCLNKARTFALKPCFRIHPKLTLWPKPKHWATRW